MTTIIIIVIIIIIIIVITTTNATIMVVVLTRYQEVLDEGIRLVIKKRQLKSQVRGLTEQDLFFREVSTWKYKPSFFWKKVFNAQVVICMGRVCYTFLRSLLLFYNKCLQMQRTFVWEVDLWWMSFSFRWYIRATTDNDRLKLNSRHWEFWREDNIWNHKVRLCAIHVCCLYTKSPAA